MGHHAPSDATAGRCPPARRNMRTESAIFFENYFRLRKNFHLNKKEKKKKRGGLAHADAESIVQRRPPPQAPAPLYVKTHAYGMRTLSIICFF